MRTYKCWSKYSRFSVKMLLSQPHMTWCRFLMMMLHIKPLSRPCLCVFVSCRLCLFEHNLIIRGRGWSRDTGPAVRKGHWKGKCVRFGSINTKSGAATTLPHDCFCAVEHNLLKQSENSVSFLWFTALFMLTLLPLSIHSVARSTTAAASLSLSPSLS